MLLELGIIEPGVLLDALEAQSKAPENARAKLGQVLVQRGALDDVALAAALSRQFGVPLADLRAEAPDPAAVELIPEELARTHKVLPLSLEGDRVHVASADPYDVPAIRALTQHCGKIAMHIGAASDVERQLDQAYNVLRSTDEMIQAFELTYDEALFATDAAGQIRSTRTLRSCRWSTGSSPRACATGRRTSTSSRRRGTCGCGTASTVR